MNQAFHLYRLQHIDTQITHIESQLKELERLLAGNETVRQAQTAIEEKGKILQKNRQALKEVEFSVRDQTVKIEQCEASLYGGKVRNPKELQDLQKEIVSLKKHLAQLEDRQIEHMVATEEAEQALQEAESFYTQSQATFLEQSAGWMGQRDQLQKTLERLLAERTPALSYITQESLDIYTRLRQRKGGTAICVVSDGACAICGGSVRPAELQTVRAAQTLVFCSSCGRILYAG
jgi:uncharacterized protein